ncbi:hypothetical protein PZA11_001757 [Diplocarpon coronariae]
MLFKSALVLFLASSISTVYASPFNAPAPKADKVQRSNQDLPALVAAALEPRDTSKLCASNCGGWPGKPS